MLDSGRRTFPKFGHDAARVELNIWDRARVDFDVRAIHGFSCRMGSSTLGVSVPAEPRYLKCIRGFLTPVFDARFPCEEVARLVLAVDEACANIIKHGQSWFKPTGRITLEVVEGKKKIEIKIRDFCKERDVEKIKPRPLDEIRPGGLGTHFINEVMDAVEFKPDDEKDGRMVLVLTKNYGGKENDEADG